MATFTEGIITISGPIQHKRGTSAALTESEYVPAAGEIVVATDTGEMRAGDGLHTWSSLPSYDGTEIANNLTTTTTGKALDAAQGKALNDKLDEQNEALSSRISEVASRVNIVEGFSSIDCGEIVRVSGEIRCDLAYDSTAAQELLLNAGLGFGHISRTYLSYEQILADLELEASSSAETAAASFADSFRIVDGANTYTYGTDFSIEQGENVDADTNEHSVMLAWDSGGAHPEGDFYVVYNGRA